MTVATPEARNEAAIANAMLLGAVFVNDRAPFHDGESWRCYHETEGNSTGSFTSREGAAWCFLAKYGFGIDSGGEIVRFRNGT
ncbi:hypothetical protein [Bradyrhizobium cenepequi]